MTHVSVSPTNGIGNTQGEKNSDQGGSEPCNQAEIHWDILTRVNANFQEILFLVELETGIFFQCIEGPKYDQNTSLNL